MNKITTYIFLVLFILKATSQTFCQKLVSQHYSIANGLPSNEVFRVYKDRTGYMWLPTDRGLCRFDGKAFKIYTVKEGLAENSSIEVKEDKNGKIWCRSYSGKFTIIDGDKVYCPKINDDVNIKLIGREYYQFELDNSLNLYIATRSDGLIYKSKFPYEKISPIQIPFGTITFFQISNNKYLTSYAWSFLSSKRDLKTVIHLKGRTKVISISKGSLKDNYFLNYAFTDEYLVISTDEIIHTISNNNGQNISTKLPFRISTISNHTDSTVLVGSFKGELAIFNLNKNTFKIIDKFPSSISNIYFADNYCWITTLSNGLYYIPNIHYSVLKSYNENLISMLPISDDSLYILKSNSEIELIINEKSSKLLNNTLPKTLMYHQRFDQSQRNYIPLVGCYNYVIDRATKRQIKNQNLTSNPSEFFVPMNGLYYKGYYAGISIYDKKGNVIQKNITTSGRLTCMYGANGIIYFGLQDGIRKLIDNNSFPLDTHSYFKQRVAAIDRIGNDTLVIATQANGIGIYNLQSKKLSIFNKSYGLDRVSIQHMFIDDEKKIWIATQQSIHLLKLNSKNELEILDVIGLHLGDLSIKEVRVLNKKVYILAGNQVIKIPESLIKFNQNKYQIVLNQLLINGENQGLKNIQTLNLKPNENNLQIKFQLLSYTQDNTIEYRYKLNNEDWIYTSSNELQLASLPSAIYQLQIQGKIKNGPWNDPLMLNFTVNHPFYKSTWVIVFTLISSLLALYFLLTYLFNRKYRKQVKEFELTRQLESARLMASKSQMNPHFIFNALSSIQNFILKSEKIEAYQYLNDFSTLIRNYLEYSNTDYIKMDKEIELLQTYIKIEQLRIPFKFELNISKKVNINEEFIFSLLIQPCLENSIWHGLNHKHGDKLLMLNIDKKGNIIEVNITDNGIGRKQSVIINSNRISKPSSVAIINLNNRIKSLTLLYKNNLTIDTIDNYDEEGSATGTSVVIKYNTIIEKD